jgi:hypothetical protein
VSKDIDIFLRDAQYITLFSPRLNDATADIAKNYEEMSNFVKLMLPKGEIDFILRFVSVGTAAAKSSVPTGGYRREAKTACAYSSEGSECTAKT